MSADGYTPRCDSSRTRYTECARGAPGAWRCSERGRCTEQKAARCAAVAARPSIISTCTRARTDRSRYSRQLRQRAPLLPWAGQTKRESVALALELGVSELPAIGFESTVCSPPVPLTRGREGGGLCSLLSLSGSCACAALFPAKPQAGTSHGQCGGIQQRPSITRADRRRARSSFTTCRS